MKNRHRLMAAVGVVLVAAWFAFPASGQADRVNVTVPATYTQ
jgi:hypothetical protein